MRALLTALVPLVLLGNSVPAEAQSDPASAEDWARRFTESLRANTIRIDGRRERAEAEHAATRVSICDETAGAELGGADAVRHWARLVAVQQRKDNADTVRYRALMNSLSADGRRSIEGYIETEVVPGMGMSNVDSLALAVEFPEWAVQNIGRICSGERAGEAAP